MAKVNLSEVQEVGDPLLTDNFELRIPNLPAGIGDSKILRIQAKTAIKPGSTIEAVLVELSGHTVRHAGKKAYSGALAISYQENNKLVITNILEAWHELIRGTESQSGAFKEEYAIEAELDVLKQDGSVSKTYKIHGLWPTEVPEIAFDASGQNVEVPANFAFDHYTW